MEYLPFLIGLFPFLFLVVAVANGSTERKIVRLDRRLARMERKLDAITENLGVHVPDPDLDRVRALLAQDKLIEAVRVYRDSTGAGLKEAKLAVDQLQR